MKHDYINNYQFDLALQAELKQLHFVELQKLENKLSEEANARVEQAQAKLKAEYGGEIEEIMADHQREIDVC